ncbi:Pol [Symbiodinium sp. CCMP2592]|nr:Pol [Symbiodinium sp. CCMP2592]
MPRSPAQTSSSSSDDVRSNSNEDDTPSQPDSDVIMVRDGDLPPDAAANDELQPTNEDGTAPVEYLNPQPPAPPDPYTMFQLPKDYADFMHELAYTALRELCFWYLAQHLCLHYPDRRVSQARYLAQRRSRGMQEPGALYAYVYVQLDEDPAAKLDADYTALANLWTGGTPENDVSWLSDVGRSCDPPKHLCLQHLSRMLRQSLCRHLDAPSATHIAMYMVDHVRQMDLLYVATLLALFPLLDHDGRHDFQHWYYGFSNRLLPCDEDEAADRRDEPAGTVPNEHHVMPDQAVEGHAYGDTALARGQTSQAKLTFLSWNAGGLTEARHQEFKTWLAEPEGRAIQVIAIQETHWKTSFEYLTDSYIAVHSGGPKAEAGLLLLVSRRAFTAAQVQSRDLIPGRLMHVRLEAEPSIDIVVGYQHTWTVPKSQPGKPPDKDHLLAKRSEYWASLAACIDQLPRRNQLLVMADFNTDLQPDSCQVGQGVYTRRTAHAPDRAALQDMLRQYQLIALNTWSRSGRPACTYLSAGDSNQSQIDFVLSRQHQQDPLSRYVVPRHMPFVPVTGMRHLPLLGSVPYPKAPRTKPPQHLVSCKQVRSLCQQHADLPCAFSRELESLHASNPSMPVNDLLSQAWRTATLNRPAPAAPKPSMTAQTAVVSVQTVWGLRKQVRLARAQRHRGLRELLVLWRTLASLRKAQKDLQARCRIAKKQRIHDLLQEAARAPAGLTPVFRLLRTIAPAAPKRKLQLRSRQGAPLGTAEAMKLIKDYYFHLFNQVTTQKRHLAPPNPVQLSHEELLMELQQIPANKALPSTELPAMLWKFGASTLASRLLQPLNAWLADMTQPPPDEWHISEICLIPKPNKPLVGPEALRPISLLHPVAKSLASALNKRLLPYLHPAVSSQPQFAYVAGRSAQDALDRALLHCRHVREIMQAQRNTIHLKRQNHQPDALRGGITLSLDLTKAFDLLPRDRLAEALEAAHVEPSLAWTILKIHDWACLRFRLGREETTIGSSNGVRQGCGLSPSL